MEIDIPTVAERDVDLLLIRAFSASANFVDWFLKQADVTTNAAKVESVRAWTTTENGESDVEVDLLNDSGELLRLLIENKISAPFQAKQAERYTERGRKYLEQGACDEFCTLLVAPGEFADITDTMGFEGRIGYEHLIEWFEQQDESFGYETTLLKMATSNSGSGWTLVVDEDATAFWRQYWQLARQNAPQLQMPEPGQKPATSSFVHFHPSSLGSGVNLIHKMPYGHVDIQFSGMGKRLEELRAGYSEHMDNDMILTEAGKSGVIRVNVPRVTPQEPFDDQRDRVRVAIAEAKRLLSWYRAYGA